MPRPGDVGDVDGELAGAALDPLEECCELRRVPADPGEGVLDALGVVLLLANPRLGVDDVESLDRVRDGERQPHREERVAIAGIVALVVKADRDADADVGERAVMALEPAPQRPGHHREDGVVERRAGELPGGVVEGPSGTSATAMRRRVPIFAVERRAVQGARVLALDERRQVSAAALVIGVLAMLGRRGRPGRPAARRSPPASSSASQSSSSANRIAGGAVGEGVVDPPDEHRAAAGAGDDVDRPERPIAIEPLLEQAGDLVELGVPVGAGAELGCADVPVDVEALVGHPEPARRRSPPSLRVSSGTTAMRPPISRRRSSTRGRRRRAERACRCARRSTSTRGRGSPCPRG